MNITGIKKHTHTKKTKHNCIYRKKKLIFKQKKTCSKVEKNLFNE